MSSGFEHLKDPTVGIPAIIDGLSGIQELFQSFQMRNDPNIIALRNLGVGNLNTLMNDFQTPFSMPMDVATQMLRNMGGQQGNASDAYRNENGVPAANISNPLQGLDLSSIAPYESTLERQAQDRAASGNPVELNEYQRGPVAQFADRVRSGDGPLRRLLGSFQQGTQSVPATGAYQLHQGEMVVPKEQNPNAMPPGVQGPPLATSTPAQPQGVKDPGGMMPIFRAAPPTPAQPTTQGTPQFSSPNIRQTTTGLDLGRRFTPVQPGLNQQAQADIISQGQDQNAQALMSQQRQIAEQAAQAGNSFGGNAQSQQFEAQLANMQRNTDLRRQVGIEAEARRFQDQMANEAMALQERTALNNAALGQGQLQLGRENLGLGRDQLALERELGNRGLGLQEDSLQLERELGRGGLDLQRELGLGSLGIERDLAALQRELGLGSLGLQERAQSLSEQLGLGQLDLQREGLDLDRLLGMGGLGVQQQLADLQGELGRGQLDLDTLLGTGGLNIQQQLANLQETLGLGDLGLRERAQEFQQGEQFDEATRQFDEGLDLQRELGLGNLDLANREFGLNEFLGTGQFDLAAQNQGFGQTLQLLQLLSNLGSMEEGFGQDMINRLFGEAGLPNAPAGQAA